MIRRGMASSSGSSRGDGAACAAPQAFFVAFRGYRCRALWIASFSSEVAKNCASAAWSSAACRAHLSEITVEPAPWKDRELMAGAGEGEGGADCEIYQKRSTTLPVSGAPLA